MKPSRFIILLIAAVMLLGTVGAVSAAPTLVVEVPTEEVEVGQTITVPVTIKESIPIVSLRVEVPNNVEGAVITINKGTLSPMFLYGGQVNSAESNPVQSLSYATSAEITDTDLKLFDLDVKITGNNIRSVPVVVTVTEFYTNDEINHASNISQSDVSIKVAKSQSIATTINITSPVDGTKLVYGTEGVATAVVYDQYGDVMVDAPVTWTAKTDGESEYELLAATGLTIDNTGAYKVVGCAEETVYINAESGDVGTSNVVNLVKAELTADDFVVYGLGEYVWTGTAFEADVEAKVTGIGNITVTYNGNETAPVSKGEYVVKISVPGGDNYLAVTDLVLGTIKITGTVITPPTIANYPTYNGKEQTVAIVDSANSAGMYEISGNTGTNAGDYTVTLTLKDTENTEWKDANSASITLEWKILPKSIEDAEITATELTYTGEVQLPAFTVTLGKQTLTEDDYTVSAENAVSAGEYDVKVTGKGNYAGEASGKWSIAKAVPIAAMISCDIPTGVVYGKSYDVTAVAAENIFGLGEITLKYNGADTAVDAGNYSVTANVTAGTNYTAASGLEVGTLIIGKADLDKDDFTLSATSAEFKNEPQAVTVTSIDGVTVTGVKYNGDSDAPTAKGTYNITVTATGGKNYNDVADLKVGIFVITGRQVAEPEINGTYAYTGSELTAVIAESADYEVTGNKATAAGTHTVVVSLIDKDNTAWKKGGTDNLELEWVIAPKPIIGASVTTSHDTDAFTYDGTVKNPTFIVTDGTMTVAETDYIIKGDVSSAAAGKHQVTIEGQNNYTGYIDEEWNIAPAVPTIDDIVITIPIDVVYGQTYEVTAVAKDTVFGLGTIKLLYNDEEAVPVNAGTYKVNASIAAGANYTAAVVSALDDLVIAKAVPVAANITCVMEDVVYDGKEHPLTATAAEGVAGLGAIKLLYNDAEAAPVANATYVVKAQIADGDNYEAATVELGSFNITKAVLTAADFTFTPALPVSYDEGSAEAVVVTVKEGIFGNGTVTVKYGDSTDVPNTEGIYKVNATFAVGANYTASEFHLGYMTIVKKVAPVFGDIGTENADGSVTISATQAIDEAKNTTTVESNGVSIVIAFSDMTKVNDNEVKGNITGVKAVYPTNDAASPFGDGVSYNLTINLGDKLTPLLPEITPVYNSTIDGKIKANLDSKTTFTGIAMMTAKGANVDFVNQNLTSVTIVFTIPKTVMDAAGGIDKLVIYHVGDAKPAKMGANNIKKAVVGDDHIITITGNGFSSYVAGTETKTSDDTPVSPGSRPSKPSSSSTVIPVTPPAEDEPSDEPSDVPGTEIPDLPQVDPTEPKSPAPIAGMILGALAAAAVLRRK